MINNADDSPSVEQKADVTRRRFLIMGALAVAGGLALPGCVVAGHDPNVLYTAQLKEDERNKVFNLLFSEPTFLSSAEYKKQYELRKSTILSTLDKVIEYHSSVGIDYYMYAPEDFSPGTKQSLDKLLQFTKANAPSELSGMHAPKKVYMVITDHNFDMNSEDENGLLGSWTFFERNNRGRSDEASQAYVNISPNAKDNIFPDPFYVELLQSLFIVDDYPLRMPPSKELRSKQDLYCNSVAIAYKNALSGQSYENYVASTAALKGYLFTQQLPMSVLNESQYNALRLIIVDSNANSGGTQQK